MKRPLVLLIAAAALGVSTSAYAQVAGPKGLAPARQEGKKAGKLDRKQMQKLNEAILAKLNLTDDQKAKLKTHREETAAKLKDLRKDAKGGGKDAELKEKMKAIRKEEQAFLKQTLTKPQMREMQKLRREAIAEMRAKKDGATTP